jgi:hypothetical protein
MIPEALLLFSVTEVGLKTNEWGATAPSSQLEHGYTSEVCREITSPDNDSLL